MKKSTILLLLTVLLLTQKAYAVTGSKTYTGQELASTWQLTDETATYQWSDVSQSGASITFGTDGVPRSLYLTSKVQFYNVTRLEIHYEAQIAYSFSADICEVGDDYLTPTGDEKGGSPLVFIKDGSGVAMGNISSRIYSGRNQTVKITSITVTYDTDGAKRNLKWSATSATAYLGQSFTGPTLSGNNLEGVTYSSSAPSVAYIDINGKVSAVSQGTATITASAPATGLWDASSASYNLTVSLPTGYVTETVTVSTPGTLKEQIVDLDTRPTKLIVKGHLNSSDLTYIAEATGKMSAVSSLDLSDISLAYDDGCYNTMSGREGADIGLGSTIRQFYLSSENREERFSTPTGLGGGTITYKIYSNNLAGLFANNTTLREVRLPKGLNAIGNYIFYSSAIANVTFPDKITDIPCSAFASTSNLKILTLPPTVKSIAESAFSSSSICEITATGITELGDNAFNQSSLEKFDLSKIIAVGKKAFYESNLGGTANLAALKKMGEYSFGGTRLIHVILNERIDSIPANAFRGKYNMTLESVSLPEGLKYIGDGAFEGNNNLNMVIPESVVYIGGKALPEAWVLKHPKENGIWYFGKVAYAYDSNVAGVENIEIKNGIKSISSGFVSDNLRMNLKKVILPDGLEQIGECVISENGTPGFIKSCFYECAKLEEINLPDGLKVIGDGTFNGCKNLKIESWPNSLEAIGQSSFLSCESIYSVTFGENLKFLGQQAFEFCPSISNVKLYSTHLVTSGSPFWNGSVEKVTIGSKVTNIPKYMFNGCSALIKVVFEDAEATKPALSIGKSAFYGCSELKIDALPTRTIEIGESAFEGISFGESMNLFNVTSIASRAFNGAKGIKELTLGSKLLKCGGGAFSDIETLRTINYNALNLEVLYDSYYASPFGRNSNFKSTGITEVNFGPDVEYIPEQLFRYHPALTKVTFAPRKDTSLAIDERAFQDCDIRSLELPDTKTSIGQMAFIGNVNLASLRLGDGTENIDRRAFWECHALKSVDIPSTVVTIGDEAFYQYSSNQYPYEPQMQYAYFHTLTPPAIGDNAFRKQTTIYVPETSQPSYAQTAVAQNTILTYAVTSFGIDKTHTTVNQGKTIKITYTINPLEFEGLDIRWTSSDPEVASVDCNGVVTGLTGGVVTITAAPAYVSGFEAKCDVTVKGSSEIEIVDIDYTLPIVVYNMSGLKVSDTLEKLQPGLYIVRQGSKAKIICKK